MPLDFGTLKTSKNGFLSLSTSKKKGRNMSFLDLSFSGSIIFVVGKSPIDIMEPIFV